MSKFKAGDKVRVLCAPGSYFAYMAEGSEHTVGKVHAGFVCLKGHPEAGWCDYRFELIEAAPKRDYVADHARRTLRAAGLSKDEAAKFVANMVAQPAACKVRPSALSRKLPYALHEFIRSAFLWSQTPEGFAYWDALSQKLNKEATANA